MNKTVNNTGTCRFNGDNYAVINKETGEIFCNDSKDEGFQTITLKQLFSNSEEKNYNFTEYTFVKSFRGNGIIFFNHFAGNELKVLLFLSDFIVFEECTLRKNGHKLGKPLSITDLAKLCSCETEAFRKTISSLRKKEAIAIHPQGTTPLNCTTKIITVNPFLLCRGAEVQKWVCDYYSSSKWADIQREAKKKK